MTKQSKPQCFHSQMHQTQLQNCTIAYLPAVVVGAETLGNVNLGRLTLGDRTLRLGSDKLPGVGRLRLNVSLGLRSREY